MRLKCPKFSLHCEFWLRITKMSHSHLTLVDCEVLFTNLLHTNFGEREMTWFLSDGSLQRPQQKLEIVEITAMLTLNLFNRTT